MAGSQPEPEPEPEPQHRSLRVQPKPPASSRSATRGGDGGTGTGTGTGAAGNSNSVSFAADTKGNDGAQRPGVARTVGRVCGKAFVNTLTQVGGLILLGAFAVLCIRAWSGTIFLWKGGLDEA